MQQPKFPSLPSAGKLLATLVAAGVLSASFQQPAEANAAKIRKFGFAGSYRGIVKGIETSRTQNQSSFNRSRVSRIQIESLPPKASRTAEGLTEGKTVRVLTTTRVTKRRVLVKSRYFGVSNNSYYGEQTIASGSETLLIRKLGTQGLRFVGRYKDRLLERTEASNVLVARRNIKGKMEKD